MSDLNREQLADLIGRVVQAVLKERGLADGAPARAAEAVGACSCVATPASGTGPALSPAAEVASPGVSVSDPAMPRVVVLLSGGGGDTGLLELSLRGLAVHCALDIILSPCYVQRYGSWRPEVRGRQVRFHDRPDCGAADEILRGGRVFAAPLLTPCIAAKASLAMADGLSPYMVIEALRRGMTVVAVRGETDPDALEVPPAMLSGPNSLRHLLETYLQRLTAWGVRWTSLEGLAPVVEEVLAGANRQAQAGAGNVVSSASSPSAPSAAAPSGSAGGLGGARRRFITREDLWGLLERGEVRLAVGSLDVVTPEAEDFAVARGIEIVRMKP